MVSPQQSMIVEMHRLTGVDVKNPGVKTVHTVHRNGDNAHQ
jgi:hypothetical protein